MPHLTNMRLLCKWLIVCALMTSVGLHWVVLQSAAWTGMVLQYAQSDGLGAALEKTLDGEHPCAWCKKIASAAQEEQKQPQRPSSTFKQKLELDWPAFQPPLHTPSLPSSRLPTPFSVVGVTRHDEPPLQPPRALA